MFLGSTRENLDSKVFLRDRNLTDFKEIRNDVLFINDYSTPDPRFLKGRHLSSPSPSLFGYCHSLVSVPSVTYNVRSSVSRFYEGVPFRVFNGDKNSFCEIPCDSVTPGVTVQVKVSSKYY